MPDPRPRRSQLAAAEHRAIATARMWAGGTLTPSETVAVLRVVRGQTTPEEEHARLAAELGADPHALRGGSYAGLAHRGLARRLALALLGLELADARPAQLPDIVVVSVADLRDNGLLLDLHQGLAGRIRMLWDVSDTCTGLLVDVFSYTPHRTRFAAPITRIEIHASPTDLRIIAADPQRPFI